MEELLIKAFDFDIRIIELAGYLEEENMRFPLTIRLLQCAVGICIYLRALQYFSKNTSEQCTEAYKLALEAECLLELMVKTGFLGDKQSEPILTDCRFLKHEIEKLIVKN